MRTLARCIYFAGGPALLLAFVSAAFGLDLKPKIDPLARPLIEDEIAVGLAIGIVKDGQTQFLAYGETVKGSGVAPRDDTIYEIGSTSKVFTGLLLADMVQAGLVKLGDPIQKYLPASVQAPVHEGQPITLEHLATHTSGLPRIPGNLNAADLSNPLANYGLDQVYSFLNGYELSRPPGKYSYSNLGMGLLGDALASHQNMTYEQLLIDRIAKPLAMQDTCITLDEKRRKRLAPGYDAALNPAKNWDFPALAGAGGLRSTCRDLLLFLQANLADDESTQLHRAMRLSHAKRHPIGNGMAIGLGWHIVGDGVSLQHNGMTGGYHSLLAVVPDENIGVVVLSNTATMQISALGQRVTRIARGQKVERIARRSEVKVDLAVLQSYVGYYAITPAFGLTISIEDGQLFLQATGQPKVPIFAESKTKFFLKAVNAQITFVPDDEGKIKKLILRQGGRDVDAVREE